jgi:hypothetical protein
MSEVDTAANGQPEQPPMPLLFRDLVGWYALATLAVGRETGMLDAVVNGPVTAASLVMTEAAATGNLDVDASSPFARIVFSANLLICLQEGLHDGGAGTGAVAGEGRITALLKAGGFGDVKTSQTGVGYTVFAARRSDIRV